MKTIFCKLIVPLFVVLGVFAASEANASPGVRYVDNYRVYKDSNNAWWGWVSTSSTATPADPNCCLFYLTQPPYEMSMALATAKSMKKQKVALFYGSGSCANSTTQWGEMSDANSKAGCYISAVELFKDPNLLPLTTSNIPFDIYSTAASPIYYAKTCSTCSPMNYYGVPYAKGWQNYNLYTSGFAAPSGTGRDTSYGMVIPATSALFAAFSGQLNLKYITGGDTLGFVGGTFGAIPITGFMVSDY